VHTAALVGEWGPWELFYQVGVQGTRNVLDAAIAAGARRVVQLSSIAVYGMRVQGRALHEFDPYDNRPEPWNHYVREKVQSERLAFQYQSRGQLEVVAVRPSVIWGSRDRTAFARTRDLLRGPLAGVIGKGLNRVPSVSVHDVADLCVRAVTVPKAAGRAYNISSDEPITQIELMRVVAACTGAPVPSRHVPFGVAMSIATAMETMAHLTRRKNPPALTRFNLLIAASDILVDTTLARDELGWHQLQSVPDAIREEAITAPFPSADAGRGDDPG
jgi:nucleoside-diphosphate-sugar epimerase